MKSCFKQYLDPSERMSELLFGLVMTLTFTLGASLVIEEGPDATRELLVGVIGCNIAWGIIDGFLYIFNAMYARGVANRMQHLLAREGRPAAEGAVDEYLEETLGKAISATTRDMVRQETIDHISRIKPTPVKMTRDDVGGAIASFLLVVVTAVPAVLPFLLFDQHLVALRVSNFLMIALLYGIGCCWAASIDASRQRVGLSLAFGGLLVVQLTIALGG